MIIKLHKGSPLNRFSECPITKITTLKQRLKILIVRSLLSNPGSFTSVAGSYLNGVTADRCMTVTLKHELWWVWFPLCGARLSMRQEVTERDSPLWKLRQEQGMVNTPKPGLWKLTHSRSEMVKIISRDVGNIQARQLPAAGVWTEMYETQNQFEKWNLFLLNLS